MLQYKQPNEVAQEHILPKLGTGLPPDKHQQQPWLRHESVQKQALAPPLHLATRYEVGTLHSYQHHR